MSESSFFLFQNRKEIARVDKATVYTNISSILITNRFLKATTEERNYQSLKLKEVHFKVKASHVAHQRKTKVKDRVTI